jgi:hypothetical protein
MFKLFPFEFLQLPRDDALVALLADPADVPLGKSGRSWPSLRACLKPCAFATFSGVFSGMTFWMSARCAW